MTNKSGVKGSTFERKIAQELSLWISGGARKDLLRRNTTSGARYTTGMSKGESFGRPGDLAISHPMAAAFCSTFLVECKHYKDLNWYAFMANPHERGPSFLHQVIDKCRAEAHHAGLAWLVIARQNNRDPYVIMEHAIGMAAWDAQLPGSDFFYHSFHCDEFMAISLPDLIRYVQPAQFITEVEGLIS